MGNWRTHTTTFQAWTHSNQLWLPNLFNIMYTWSYIVRVPVCTGEYHQRLLLYWPHTTWGDGGVYYQPPLPPPPLPYQGVSVHGSTLWRLLPTTTCHHRTKRLIRTDWRDRSPVGLRSYLLPLPSRSKGLPVRTVAGTLGKHAALEDSVYLRPLPYTHYFKMSKVCCVCCEGKEANENRLFRCGGQGCGITVHQGNWTS